MKPAAILFDLDDVLCAYDVERRIADLARATGCAPDHIRRAVFTQDFFDRADTGVFPDGEAYLSAFCAALGHPVSRAVWIAARAAGMTPWPDMLALAARLGGQGIPIGIYTNNDALFRETLPQLVPQAVALFGPAIVVSASLGMMKPEPESFRRACARLGFDPARTLFIDDRAENIAGAEAAGCAGHLFEGTAGLMESLLRLGVTP